MASIRDVEEFIINYEDINNLEEESCVIPETISESINNRYKAHQIESIGKIELKNFIFLLFGVIKTPGSFSSSSKKREYSFLDEREYLAVLQSSIFSTLVNYVEDIIKESNIVYFQNMV